MKKLFAFLIAALMMFSVISCTDDSDKNGNNSGDNGSENTGNNGGQKDDNVIEGPVIDWPIDD